MEAFEYNASTARVIFGNGTRSNIPYELARQHLSASLLLSTPRQAEMTSQLQEILKEKAAGVFTGAKMHTPIHVTEEALEYAKSINADSIISIGGGSTIGLGKAISFRTGLPHIAIPTTYAGSEMTPILGETRDEKKTTRKDPKILPGTVIYDVDLTLTLPEGISATSGINAIAHAIEALYAQNANPIISLLAVEGINALARSLPEILETPSNVPARETALYGAWLCGTCLGSVGMSLHHKLCHTLGGSFNMPHAETHTVILPHALAYNAPAIGDKDMKKLADAFPGSEGNPIKALNTLLDKLKVKRGLRDFGFKKEDIDKAAELATIGNPYWNPRVVETDLIRELLRRAWAGEDAREDL